MTAFFEKSYKNTRTIHMCDLDEQGRLKNPPAKLPGDFCACAPGERTFYRVKDPNPPGSGKG